MPGAATPNESPVFDGANGVGNHVEQENDHGRGHELRREAMPALLEVEGARTRAVGSERLADGLHDGTRDDADAQRLDATRSRGRGTADRHRQDDDEERSRTHGEENLPTLERREAKVEAAREHLEQTTSHDVVKYEPARAKAMSIASNVTQTKIVRISMSLKKLRNMPFQMSP